MPGGFGERGIEGKIQAVRYAREHGMPYLGICLGMQLAIIEYARNVAGLEGAHSTEFNRDSPHPVIALITEWQDQKGTVEAARRAARTSAAPCASARRRCGSRTARWRTAIYGADVIRERHRHRFEFNNNYLQKMMNAGLRFSGFSRDGLVEIVELPDHPFFIASQFHPEFRSTPRDGHPLFTGFIRAARDYRAAQLAGCGGRMRLCGFEVGLDRPFFLIAGPCVIESEALVLEVAGRMKEITRELGIPTSSRRPSTRRTAPRGRASAGPGIEAGLAILAEVQAELGLPVLTDVHEDTPLAEVAAVVDVLQTPAFLCRQTNFIVRVASAGQARQHQEGPVPLALGDGERRGQGPLDRQRGRSWSASAGSASATTTWYPTCAAWR